MNVSELATRSGLWQGSRAASQYRTRTRTPKRNTAAQLWEQTGLKDVGTEKVARGLGWFSIGLGLTELLAPRLVARLCGGQGRHTGLIRLYGLREIASGLMIFSQGKKPASAVWSRVAGDVVDLATLGTAALSSKTNKAGVLFGTVSVLGVAAVDVMCAQELSREKGQMTESGATRVKHSIAINRSPEYLYQFWSDLKNLPRFMYHLESVEVTDERRSHWVTQAPGGQRVEWDSEITADEPNQLIAWRSLPGGDVENSGSVRFEPRPAGRGSIVRVELEYTAPGGVAGAAFAKLFNQSPEQQIYDDLRRLKQVVETGEVVRSDGSPEGSGQVLQRPAQPLP
jgi:uncharacterized membrane protein